MGTSRPRAVSVVGYLQRQTSMAMEWYNAHYDNEVYEAATLGRGVDRCNALIDSALALSGHPGHQFQYLEWDELEADFLCLFIGD